MTAAILGLQITSALLMIIFILLHAGRGGGLSDLFGGAGASLGGSTIVERNLDRITVVTAVIFATTTVLLHFRIR